VSEAEKTRTAEAVLGLLQEIQRQTQAAEWEPVWSYCPPELRYRREGAT
jgi:hypothetical protein